MPEYHPSPADWRDLWVYFVLVDRFDNPAAPPRQAPWDGEHGGFQGGTLAGVRARLDYLAELGAGALWLSPSSGTRNGTEAPITAMASRTFWRWIRAWPATPRRRGEIRRW